MKKYSKLAILFIMAMALLACSAVKGDITVETHPDSKIVYMLDACGLDPVSTGRTISDIVIMEIVTGKFTKAEVITFVEKRIDEIKSGITYYRLVHELETYGKLYLERNAKEPVSNVAVVGYMMIKRKLDLAMLRVKLGLVNQDKEITLRLLKHILSEVEKYT